MRTEDDWQRIEQENQALRQLVQQLQEQVQQLQNQLAKNSRNSHLPPSSDRWQRQPKSLRQKSERTAGGQPNHPGNTLMQTTTPDLVIEHEITHCPHCQTTLDEQPVLHQQRRQVVDWPLQRVQYVEHRIQWKACPTCQQVASSVFPEDVSAPIQFGPRLGALALYLSQQQFLPNERTCQVIHEMCGLSMSPGTLQHLIARGAEHLTGFEQQLKEHLQQEELLHQDETGLYVQGKRSWMHVCCTSRYTHYAVHSQRGHQALDEIGIMPLFQGISLHDGWASYKLYTCRHALCNVHHLRELTGIQEQYQQAWAGQMKELLLQIKQAVEQAKTKGFLQLPALQRASFLTRYRDLLALGYQANPPPRREEGQAGRLRQHPARNLLDRLQQQDHVLAFMEDFRVPFDNSQAERDIRMVKVQQKISGGFRSEAGAHAFCRIRSYLSTLAKQGYHLLTALEMALVGQPLLSVF